ncbi:zinc knuckle CX2CX4HX4C containing protein [Tanacetum coccineum]
MGGEGDGVANWTSSGVIGERLRVMSIDAFFLELEEVEELLEEEMLMSSTLEMEAIVDEEDGEVGLGVMAGMEKLSNTNSVKVSITNGEDLMHNASIVNEPAGVSSRLINETNVETLFGVKFTSLSDIDDFSMSIKEGKYADILSTMSSANIDVAVNVIETIRKKFQDEVNKASGTQFSSSSKVSNSSPLVYPSTTINMPRELNSIDVAATFGVSLTTVGDLHKLINDIKAGKHEELLPGMTNDDCMESLDALGSICNSIHVNCNNMPSKESPSDPIVQSVDINTKSTSYADEAGASTMAQPQINSNFGPLVADPRLAFPIVEYYARNNWGKHGLKRVMMNTKGFFFFKFESKVGLEAVLENGPWMIRNTPIIFKKWSMSTSLLKEELTRIPIWVKLHDVPLQVFEEDGISLIATFIRKPIMLDSYTSSMCKDSWGRSSFTRCLIEVNSEANSEADLVDSVTIGIPSLTGDDFTKETICVEYEWRPPRCDKCKIFSHVHDPYPKKMASPPIVTTSNVVAPTFTGPSVKQTVRYEPKATTSAPKKGATNVSNPSRSSSMLKTADTSPKNDNFTTSNSFSALNAEEEDDEEVENVFTRIYRNQTRISDRGDLSIREDLKNGKNPVLAAKIRSI